VWVIHYTTHTHMHRFWAIVHHRHSHACHGRILWPTILVLMIMQYQPLTPSHGPYCTGASRRNTLPQPTAAGAVGTLLVEHCSRAPGRPSPIMSHVVPTQVHTHMHIHPAITVSEPRATQSCRYHSHSRNRVPPNRAATTAIVQISTGC